jgi:hypothetical protein
MTRPTEGTAPMDSEDRQEDTVGPETEEGRQAMAGLRAIWTATGQLQDEIVRLDCRPDAEGCAASIGFDGFAEAVEPTTNTTEAIERLRRAWKTTLAREGKLVGPEAEGPE